MVKYSELSRGMVVTFDRSSVDIDRWRRLKQKSIRSPNYTNAEDWYKRTIGKLENIPIKIKGYESVQHDGDGYAGPAITYTQHLNVETLDGRIKSHLDEEWFDPNNTNAFKNVTAAPAAPAAPVTEPTPTRSKFASMRGLPTKSGRRHKTRKGRRSVRRTRKH